MKGHKHSVHEIAHMGVHGAPKARMARKEGGKVESAMRGIDEAAEDLKDRPERYNESRVEGEAEEKAERKAGGRAKRKMGGHVKHVGKVEGEACKPHAGRKPRKSGGRAFSTDHPFTSALPGTPARGRKLEHETEGSNE